jgi:hypothetical protein
VRELSESSAGSGTGTFNGTGMKLPSIKVEKLGTDPGRAPGDWNNPCRYSKGFWLARTEATGSWSQHSGLA